MVVFEAGISNWKSVSFGHYDSLGIFFKEEGLAYNFESESYCSPFANLNTQLFFCGICVYSEHVIICLTGKYHSHGERGLIDTFTKPASGNTEGTLGIDCIFF